MRKIDADGLKETISEEVCRKFVKWDKTITVAEFETFVKDIIDNAPTVPQGECRTCRHRDPEDKKCDCGGLERQGCPFPVSDDYFCKFYEKGGAE